MSLTVRVLRLEAEMALAAAGTPLLLQGDAIVLPAAFARVPAGALPVVSTTWALAHFPIESRLRFLHRAVGRRLAARHGHRSRAVFCFGAATETASLKRARPRRGPVLSWC